MVGIDWSAWFLGPVSGPPYLNLVKDSWIRTHNHRRKTPLWSELQPATYTTTKSVIYLRSHIQQFQRKGLLRGVSGTHNVSGTPALMGPWGLVPNKLWQVHMLTLLQSKGRLRPPPLLGPTKFWKSPAPLWLTPSPLLTYSVLNKIDDKVQKISEEIFLCFKSARNPTKKSSSFQP